MFCRNCGCKLPDDSKFCNGCGAPTGVGDNYSAQNNQVNNHNNNQFVGQNQYVNQNGNQFGTQNQYTNQNTYGQDVNTGNSSFGDVRNNTLVKNGPFFKKPIPTWLVIATLVFLFAITFIPMLTHLRAESIYQSVYAENVRYTSSSFTFLSSARGLEYFYQDIATANHVGYVFYLVVNVAVVLLSYFNRHVGSTLVSLLNFVVLFVHGALLASVDVPKYVSVEVKGWYVVFSFVCFLAISIIEAYYAMKYFRKVKNSLK